MIYHTKGTVQLIIDNAASADFKVIITPTQPYAIKLENKDLTLFVETPLPPSGTPSALLFERTQKFTVNSSFQSALLSAAAVQVCVELRIDYATQTEIVGITLPVK
ncbi:MAG: hypothetical protein WCK65_10240 [Rhodospirillaceae bacterium]